MINSEKDKLCDLNNDCVLYDMHLGPCIDLHDCIINSAIRKYSCSNHLYEKTALKINNEETAAVKLLWKNLCELIRADRRVTCLSQENAGKLLNIIDTYKKTKSINKVKAKRDIVVGSIWSNNFGSNYYEIKVEEINPIKVIRYSVIGEIASIDAQRHYHFKSWLTIDFTLVWDPRDNDD